MSFKKINLLGIGLILFSLRASEQEYFCPQFKLRGIHNKTSQIIQVLDRLRNEINYVVLPGKINEYLIDLPRSYDDRYPDENLLGRFKLYAYVRKENINFGVFSLWTLNTLWKNGKYECVVRYNGDTFCYSFPIPGSSTVVLDLIIEGEKDGSFTVKVEAKQEQFSE